MTKQTTVLPFLPIGRHLTVLSKRYVGVLTKKLEDLDIERHYSLLLLLHYKPDCNQKCIGDILHIDKTSLVGVIDYLEGKGYVKRELNPNDRREYFIRLTEKAKQEIPQIIDAVNTTNMIALKGFTEEEVRTFFRVLSEAYDNLGNEPVNNFTVEYKKIPNKTKSDEE